MFANAVVRPHLLLSIMLMSSVLCAQETQIGPSNTPTGAMWTRVPKCPICLLLRPWSRSQYGCKGHVLNLPQNVQGFVADLPRRVQDSDILVLKRQMIPKNC